MEALELNWKLHPKQKLAYQSPATEILFGGATRGGKSHFIRVKASTLCLKIPQLQCVLIRKKNQDILDNHVYGRNGFKHLLKDLEAQGLVKVTQDAVSFYNGSRISFKHCQDERQFDSAQGIGSNVLIIDEATQISERLLRTFRAWCTMTEEMKAELPDEFKGKLPLIIYTANPIGVSVSYFKRNFVNPCRPEEIRQVDGFKRQYIPSRVADNPSEDPMATAGRVRGMHDAAISQALLEGDWNAPVGEFFPEWDEAKHVVPDFIPPAHWYRYRTFDWGSYEPFCTYWWAVSDGEGFTDQKGNRRWFPKGSLICYREWFGCDPEDPTRGLGYRNLQILEGILRRSSDPSEANIPTLSDSLPFQDRGGPTIAEIFNDNGNGIVLTKADTSREPGWSQVRDRLIGIKISPEDTDTTPLIYFVDSCRYVRDYLPALTRHQTKAEDAVEDGEATHSADCVRYACAARPMVKQAPAEPPKTEDLKNNWTFDNAIKLIQESKQEHGW